MAENGLRAALLETIAGLMSTEQVPSSAEWLKFIPEREIIGSLSISKDEMKHCTVSVKIESRSREVKQRSK